MRNKETMKEAQRHLLREKLVKESRKRINEGAALEDIVLMLLGNDNLFGGQPNQADPFSSPQAAHKPHFPAKAKSVIYLFMAGGPSQLELFDYKPKLQELNGQPIPESFIKNKRFAFMDLFTKEVPKLLGTKRRFARHGQCGAYVSECLPHLAGVVDDIAFVLSAATDVFNHAPAKIFANTGAPQVCPPSIASWVSYGICSDSRYLPA